MNVSSTYGVSQRSQVAEENRAKMNINDFLQIMVAEIQNINPMGAESGSKTDYISQMVQFSTLEQMSSIAEGINILTLMGQQQYSFSLIGKEVTINTGKTDDKGNPISTTGTVDKVKFQSGYISVEVGGKDYYLGNVLEVGNVKTNTDKGSGTETEEDK